jgi:acetyl esterase/lipase
MKTLILAMLCLCLLVPAFAQEKTVTFPIWPHFAPGETTMNTGQSTTSGGVTRLTDVTSPQMTVYPLAHAKNMPAVIVFPGGGYSILATDLEGSEIAQWLNSLGFVAAVLDYRVPNNRDGAYQDAQRAVSVLRARAKEFEIDPKRLGVIGFSAGGHLAARLTSNLGVRTYTPVDKADRESDAPDFTLLVYPAYLIDAKTGQPSPEVTPRTGMPPMFLAQTRDDPYLDAPAYAAALEAVDVPTKCMIYPKGGHGYGLRLPATDAAHAWSTEAATWLEQFQKHGK